MSRAEIMSSVRREVDVGEYIFQVRPKLCVRQFVVIKNIMNEGAQMFDQRLEISRWFKERRGKIGLKRKASVMRKPRSDNVNMRATQSTHLSSSLTNDDPSIPGDVTRLVDNAHQILPASPRRIKAVPRRHVSTPLTLCSLHLSSRNG